MNQLTKYYAYEVCSGVKQYLQRLSATTHRVTYISFTQDKRLALQITKRRMINIRKRFPSLLWEVISNEKSV